MYSVIVTTGNCWRSCVHVLLTFNQGQFYSMYSTPQINCNVVMINCLSSNVILHCKRSFVTCILLYTACQAILSYTPYQVHNVILQCISSNIVLHFISSNVILHCISSNVEGYLDPLVTWVGLFRLRGLPLSSSSGQADRIARHQVARLHRWQ